MINRQRLGLLLTTSALIGSFGLPLSAGELPLPPVGATVPAIQAPSKALQITGSTSKPARPVSAKAETVLRHRSHRVTAIALSVPQPLPPPRLTVQPELVEIASSAPQASLLCRLWCSGPLVFGVTY